jgi:hypothetical protein
MATCHSIAHARLMGAISLKRYRQFVSHEPSRATAPEGFLFSEARFVQRSEKRETRIPGLARAIARVQKRGACRRERGESRTPMTGRTKRGFASVARHVRERHDDIRFAIWFAAFCGSMNAGGEDFGYFVPGKCGFESRLWRHVPWRRPHEGRRVAGSGSSARKSLRCRH